MAHTSCSPLSATLPLYNCILMQHSRRRLVDRLYFQKKHVNGFLLGEVA